MAPASSFAGQWSQKCEQAGAQSKAACQGHSNAAKAADNAQAAGAQQQLGTGGVVKGGADALRQQGQAQAARLSEAKNKCQQEKQKCEQECDAQEKDRQSKASLPGPPDPPIKTLAKADQGQVEAKKQSSCIMPIMAMMGDLGSGAGQASQAANDAGKTSGASSGMPMPMPTPSGGEKGDQSGAATNNLAATDTLKLTCETASDSRYSDCNNDFINKCQATMTATGCNEFINRYCGNYSPTPTPGNDSLNLSTQTTNNAAATANLVADKQGEGLGSPFCKKVAAYKFCQMAGRSECPSCKNQNSPWPMESNPGQLADAQKTCPTDPMFMEADIQKKMNDNTAGTTKDTGADGGISTSSIDRMSNAGGAMGSGGGGTGISAQSQGAGGAGSAPGASGVANSGAYSGPNLAMGSGYAGDGGGGAYEGGASGPGYQPSSVNGNASRAPAAAGTTQGGPQDVAKQYGPSVFSIQSTTYRDLCHRGRFLHCRR